MSLETALPLKPPTEDVAGKIQSVLDLRPAIDDWVHAAASREAGIKNVYLVGCGGSLFNFSPLQYFLETEADVPVFLVNAAEFTYRQPTQLGAGSLVIASSTRGNTPETAKAAEFAASRGAAVVAITQGPESIVAQAAPAVFLHDGAEAKGALQALLGFAIARELGSSSTFDAEESALRQYADIIASALDETAHLFDRIAAEQHGTTGIYVVASGPNTGAAQTLAMCYLQEMQWLPASAFDAGEFLHGAMEIVVDDTPVIVFIGEDATRPMGERIQAFLERFTTKGYVIDTAGLSLAGVPTSVRPFVSSWLFHSAFTGRLAQYFEAYTGQPLTTRRYMWKVEY